MSSTATLHHQLVSIDELNFRHSANLSVLWRTSALHFILYVTCSTGMMSKNITWPRLFAAFSHCHLCSNANTGWEVTSKSFLEVDSCSGVLLFSILCGFTPVPCADSAGFIKSELRRQNANLLTKAAVSMKTFFLWLLIYLRHVAAGKTYFQ